MYVPPILGQLLDLHVQLGFEHWVLDGPPNPKRLGFGIYFRMHQFKKYHLLRYCAGRPDFEII